MVGMAEKDDATLKNLSMLMHGKEFHILCGWILLKM